jgi:ferredoxin/predicted transcriptional regulator
MSQNNYSRMIARMNKNFAKHLESDTLINFLKELYTEEQAALIADFPLGAYTSKQLSEILSRDETELDKMLREMSENGLIFEAKNANGEREYSVLAFEPGLIEMQFLKAKDDEKTRKMAHLVATILNEERAVIKKVIENPERITELNPEIMAELLKGPPARVISVEESVSTDKEVASWERVSTMIENENSYAVGECGCKHIAKLNGKPCEADAPSKCCIWFGKLADYLVEGDYATRLTKEEVFALVKECQEAGLIQCTGNRNKDRAYVLCNCCKCCCVYLNANREVRDFGISIVEVRFQAQVDNENCTGCGECVDLCQLEALQLSDDIVRVNEKYCIGCGVCVSTCPTQCISLKRVSDTEPPELTLPIVGSGV